MAIIDGIRQVERQMKGNMRRETGVYSCAHTSRTCDSSAHGTYILSKWQTTKAGKVPITTEEFANR